LNKRWGELLTRLVPVEGDWCGGVSVERLNVQD